MPSSWCHRILVGVDPENGAGPAIALATALARASGATLTALAVFEDETETLGKMLHGRFVADEAKRLYDRLEPGFDGVEHRVEAVVSGSPSRALYELAERDGFDLIVLGPPRARAAESPSRDGTGIRLLEGGSCAIALATESGRGLRADDVVVGYDGSVESATALFHAAALALELDVPLVALAVVEPAKTALLASDLGELREIQERVDRAYRDRRQRLVAALAEARVNLPTELEVRTEIVDGDPVEALAAASGEAALLVVGSRNYGPPGHTALGTVSASLISDARCPLIVVPRPAENRAGDLAGASRRRA